MISDPHALLTVLLAMTGLTQADAAALLGVKAFALLALASITINLVKWLFRHLRALILVVAILSIAAWLR